MEVYHHYCALVHISLGSFEELTTLFVVAYSLVACRQNVSIELYCAFEGKLILGKNFIKPIAADWFVFVENLILLSYE